jgi:hypothetical protein
LEKEVTALNGMTLSSGHHGPIKAVAECPHFGKPFTLVPLSVSLGAIEHALHKLPDVEPLIKVVPSQWPKTLGLRRGKEDNDRMADAERLLPGSNLLLSAIPKGTRNNAAEALLIALSGAAGITASKKVVKKKQKASPLHIPGPPPADAPQSASVPLPKRKRARASQPAG